jgi:hypothetical protein
MNQNNSTSIAAAKDFSSEDVAATFERLRALKTTCRPLVNSNELAIIMTKAIISEG